MVKLPPVINSKAMEKDFVKNKDYGGKILRFHYLKPKPEKEYGRM